jgi:hypothetical protein
VFNDVGETYAHAIIKETMLDGVASTQKQYRGSLVKNGLNANALNSQELTDMGDGPNFLYGDGSNQESLIILLADYLLRKWVNFIALTVIFIIHV